MNTQCAECDHNKTQLWLTVGELIVLMITISGLFLWSRSETRADIRRIEDLVSTIHNETFAEMKDFHGRLCALEEKNKAK